MPWSFIAYFHRLLPTQSQEKHLCSWHLHSSAWLLNLHWLGNDADLEHMQVLSQDRLQAQQLPGEWMPMNRQHFTTHLTLMETTCMAEKRKKRKNPRQADSPSTAFLKYSTCFHTQKRSQKLFSLSSLMHHEGRTGMKAWPKSPGRALEILSFLALLFWRRAWATASSRPG